MLTGVAEDDWTWDETLYAGSAPHYVAGRMPYPAELGRALVEALRLDGTGRLLDVGCGPGSLTLLLAPNVGEAVGVDPDAGMLAQAARRASEQGVRNVSWHRLRAEDLPAALGTFRAVTFAQSFHWMDQHQVATAVHGMLEPGGACVHVHAITHRGVSTEASLEHPEPPHEELLELVGRYLDPARPPPNRDQVDQPREAEVYRAAGFTGPQRITIPRPVVTRTIDELIAAVFSLSSSTPYLFGENRSAFESEARRLLHQASPSGLFSEQMREIAADIWRP
jgi:SAM-dependent methyltransferase